LTLCAVLASIATLALLMLDGTWPVRAQLGPVATSTSLTTATALTADTANAENVELVGHIGGATYAVFVQENYAYVGEGPRLTILDISSPVSPTVVGKTPPWSDFVQDIYVSGSYAYIAADRAGLRVVDVSDPAAPTEVGLYDAPVHVNGVAVAGGYAYVADWPTGLRVVDVTNPAAPVEVGVYGTPGEGADVAVVGGYAYVAVSGGGLRVVDVSDPAAPTEVGFYDTPGSAGDVVVAGSYAYVADGQFGGLRVVDVSDPAAPTEVGFYDTPGSAVGVGVAGSYAYVGDWTEGLRVVDVSDPANPTEVGFYDTLTYAWGVAMAGDYAYVADGYDGLRVVDVSDPAAPAEVGFYDTPAYAHDVAVAGGYAYVADREGQVLWVVDVSDPAAPAEVGFYDTAGFAEGVTVVEGYAYVAETGGLRVVDISDPAALVEAGFYDRPGSVYGVAVVGGYAYVANDASGLRVVDVSDPAAPVEVGFYNTPGFAKGVTVVGAYAYVADATSGLRVMDVSDPAYPTEVGFCDTPGSAQDVAVAEGYAFVADWTDGLRVVDISVPVSPTEVASFYPGAIGDVGVAGEHAYVAGGSGGLRVVDISDPAAPAEVGFYRMPGYANGVAVVGDHVYIADDDSGLFILRYIKGESSPTLYPISNPDGDGDYTVDWSDVTGALTYTLQEDDNAGFASPTTRSTGSVSQYTISSQAPGTWYYRVKASNAGEDSPWSNVVSTTVNPSPEGDAYEPDDTCTQASALMTDGTVQQHTFHQYADADWATFDAIAGTTYLIEGQVPADSPADVVLEIYDRCDGFPVDGQDHTFSPGVRLEFQASASGPFYLKLLNHAPSVYGPQVAYHLSVRALEDTLTPGAVVLVAGRLRENDPLQDNIHNVTDGIYRLFLAHGYDDGRVTYLATDTGLDGVDALATAASLEAAVTTWAQGKVSPDRPFTLYLTDHGGYDKLYLDKPRGEWVTPQEVDGWLAQLEAAVPGVKVNVIVEACHSGSFIDLPQKVSGPGRVVIASTGAYALAHASSAGAVFSDHFISALEQGESLYAGFQTARWAVQSAHPDQTPWLDDDGDGIANETGEGQEAARRGFTFAGTLGDEAWPPYVVQATGPAEVEQGQGVIRAEVRDDERVRRVWAVIYPPSYQPPESGEEMPQENLPTIVLLDQGSDWYGATYTGFDEVGVYRVVVYAEDDGGLEARPLAIEVRTGWQVNLPLVLKQG
jgi:hypothetical protein